MGFRIDHPLLSHVIGVDTPLIATDLKDLGMWKNILWLPSKREIYTSSRDGLDG